MAGTPTYTMIIDLKPDLTELNQTIDRVEGLIARLEALGNTPEYVTVNYYVPQIPTKEEVAAQLRSLAQMDYRKGRA